MSILRHPDPERQFTVEVDASNTGVGAVLSQRHGEPAKLYPCASSPANSLLLNGIMTWAIANYWP